MAFEPDDRHVLAVATNRKPTRLPIYEHIISNPMIEAAQEIRRRETSA